ncbi:NADPH:quinone reductase-like Zn-dependent oxidoreductase [Friedmanniella endophytica]|uniref:NADPH:quinone reductase-like Zn-dependent oxidoreductase n=1 Tax=Microlunatus kandeliicorticis TaxID=1759536 RepID=A0A7W3IRE9_9ACTN|nr:NADP-dependent oxidoreductase [Microlunatus kandeliicorticis]MBA8793869.1 NADPH:quinone reductase-like Zn-dependent oxidoreductase [Microlunatus kandeliicorticis]
MTETTTPADGTRAVRFDRYGDRDVLRVESVERPVPGPGEVLVAIRAAGINPGEAAIRRGFLDAVAPSTFPSGQGSDLAGVVLEVGPDDPEQPDAPRFAVGDEVLGYSWTRSSHATHAAVPATQLVAKPAGLSWEVAGGLYVVGATAWAAIEAVDPQPGEVVAVSGAAGGVGTLVTQLLAARGVRVLGISSAANADWLTAHGAEFVDYHGDVAAHLRAAADRIDAFIDLHGDPYVQLAVDLGISPDRIDTIIDFAGAERLGAHAEGSVAGSRPEVLRALAGRLAAGELELPIAATYPLDRVADAFAELEEGHTHGKIVLIP